jgi:hypothetical protein
MNKYIDQGRYYPNLNIEERERAYNGMGAEWMDERIRATLDKCFDEFEDAVRIHDVDYIYGNCESDKVDADNRFLHNMRMACWYEIPWYRTLKYLRFMGYAKLLYLCVHLGGGTAFNSKNA